MKAAKNHILLIKGTCRTAGIFDIKFELDEEIGNTAIGKSNGLISLGKERAETNRATVGQQCSA